jgi:hypothetical protein
MTKGRGIPYALTSPRCAAEIARSEERDMRDTTDPNDMDMVDRVGANRSPNEGHKDGVIRWFGFGLEVWVVVILIAISFVVAIVVFAL